MSACLAFEVARQERLPCTLLGKKAASLLEISIVDVPVRFSAPCVKNRCTAMCTSLQSRARSDFGTWWHVHAFIYCSAVTTYRRLRQDCAVATCVLPRVSRPVSIIQLRYRKTISHLSCSHRRVSQQMGFKTCRMFSYIRSQIIAIILRVVWSSENRMGCAYVSMA